MTLKRRQAEEQRKQSAIQLLRSMYGNVDAAIKFFKISSAHVTEINGMGMKQSLFDPCIFYKLDSGGNLMLMISVPVDDCAVTGNETDIESFMDNVEKYFNITRDGEISKHLGVIYEWREMENGKIYCEATMDKNVAAIIESYEQYIGKEAKIFSTQGTPNKNLIKHKGDEY